jgi:hypothetical protein
MNVLQLKIETAEKIRIPIDQFDLYLKGIPTPMDDGDVDKLLNAYGLGPGSEVHIY